MIEDETIGMFSSLIEVIEKAFCWTLQSHGSFLPPWSHEDISSDKEAFCVLISLFDREQAHWSAADNNCQWLSLHFWSLMRLRSNRGYSVLSASSHRALNVQLQLLYWTTVTVKRSSVMKFLILRLLQQRCVVSHNNSTGVVLHC